MLVFKKFLAFFIPVGVLALLGLLWFYSLEVKSHINLVKQKEKNSVEVGEELIHDSIDPILEDLTFLVKISSKLYGQHLLEDKSLHFQILEQTFQNFARSHLLYDQIRLFDKDGWEKIRVNVPLNEPQLVPTEELQDKHQRYYFKDTLKLAPDQIFISPLDLNIEHGKIEEPYKPMIRFGQVITDLSGEKIGMVTINYKAQALLDILKSWSERQIGDFMLLNQSGYWLFGNHEMEWAFMFMDRLDESFAKLEPELWSTIINSQDKGQVMQGKGLYTYKTVRPLHSNIVSSTGSPTAAGDSEQLIEYSDYYWKIVSLVPGDEIALSQRDFRQKTLVAAVLVMSVLAFFSYLLGRAQVRRDQSAAELKKANEVLEDTVQIRTRQLQHQNDHLLEEISIRKETELALHDTEYRHTTLIETMREGLVVLDLEGQITYCNRRFAEMLEYDVQELVDLSMEDVLRQEDRDFFRQQLEYRKKGQIRPYELNLRTKSGGKLLTSVSPALLVDKQQNITGSFGVITDITAQREAEVRKRYLEQQLQQTQKMEALGTLAGGIAHDFNNILSAIIGHAELAMEAVDPDSKVARSFEVILSAGNRATKLVHQILAFSRQTIQDKQPLEIVPIVKETMKLIRAATSSSISIELNHQDNVGHVMADPTQIHQIVMNLCTNACQAMAGKGGKLTLIIKTVQLSEEDARAYQLQAGDFVCLVFNDTGAGISEEIQQRIFEPFFTTKEIGKGTGLGLSLVHSIVTDLGGVIRVDSKPGQGTSFTIHLPISLQKKTEGKLPNGKIFRGNNENVIWVDDEEPLMAIGCQILSMLGYQGTGFTDPEQCLEEIVKNPDRYQLIISDYHMPKMNGLSLVKKIRDLGLQIPAIICSGFSEEITPEQLREIGVHQYLMKPVHQHEIGLAVHQALHTK